MNFEKPRLLWGEPFFKLSIRIDFRNGIYSLQLIVAYLSVFELYRVSDFGQGITILGFGIQSD